VGVPQGCSLHSVKNRPKEGSFLKGLDLHFLSSIFHKTIYTTRGERGTKQRWKVGKKGKGANKRKVREKRGTKEEQA